MSSINLSISPTQLSHDMFTKFSQWVEENEALYLKINK